MIENLHEVQLKINSGGSGIILQFQKNQVILQMVNYIFFAELPTEYNKQR